MYRVIRAAKDYSDQEWSPSYEERKELGQDLLDIVKKYFMNQGGNYGSEHGSVQYSWYHRPHYTFTVGSNYRNSHSFMVIDCEEYEQKQRMQAFRSEVRTYLKSKGFTKLSIGTQPYNGKYMDRYGSTNIDTRKMLNYIAFE